MTAGAGQHRVAQRAHRMRRSIGPPACRRDRPVPPRTGQRRRSRDCGCVAPPSAGPAAGSAASTSSRSRSGWRARAQALPPPNCARRCRGNERPGDGLDHAARRKLAPRAADTALASPSARARATPCRRGIGAEGTLSRPAMRTTSSTRSAVPPTSGRQLGAVTLTFCALAGDREAQRFERTADLLLVDAMPPSFCDQPKGKSMTRLASGGAPATFALDGVPPATSSISWRRKIEAGQDEGRIDAALEAVARIAVDAGLAAGGRRAHGVEIGALDQDVFASRWCSRCPRRRGCRRSPARRDRRRSRTWCRRRHASCRRGRGTFRPCGRAARGWRPGACRRHRRAAAGRGRG